MQLSLDAIILLAEVTKTRLYLLNDAWLEGVYEAQLTDVQKVAKTDLEQANKDLLEIDKACTIDISKQGHSAEAATTLKEDTVEKVVMFCEQNNIDFDKTMPMVVQWCMWRLFSQMMGEEMTPFLEPSINTNTVGEA